MKKLTGLALVFVALAAFVYFYEIAGEEARDQARELEESLFRIEEDEIASLRISRTGADPVELRKSDEGWLLKAPIVAAADATTVDSLLRDIDSAKRSKTFDDPDGQLEAYGLDSPQARLSIETDELTSVLELGNKDYTGTQIYARLEGEQGVYLTSTSLLTSLEKDLIDWRNKDVLALDRGKVEAIQIERETDRIELVKRDGTWLLESPLAEKADGGKVSSLLSSLESAKAEDFVTEVADELGDYGLQTPRVIVRVRETGEEAWRQLEVGTKAEGENAEDATWFARDPQRTPIFTLKQDLLDDLVQDVWEFRDRDVVDVMQDEVQSLKLTHGETEILVRREEYRWLVETPGDFKGQEAQTYKLWYPIDDIEFESIEDRVRTIPEPDVELSISLVDGTTRNYRFKQQGEDYFAEKVESDRTGTISAEDFAKLKVSPEGIVGQ